MTTGRINQVTIIRDRLSTHIKLGLPAPKKSQPDPRVSMYVAALNLLTIAPWTIAFCVATRSPDHLSVEIVQSRPDSPGRSCHLFSVARF